MRGAPKPDPAKALIEAMLTDDLTALPKQRRTARRVLVRPVDEYDLTDLTYSAVRDYVARRRPETFAAAGKVLEQGCVPQPHEPGTCARLPSGDKCVPVRKERGGHEQRPVRRWNSVVDEAA